MAKFIHPTSYHLPTGGNVLESKTFIYQVTLYRYIGNCIELLDNKFLSSTTPLKILKNSNKIKTKGCFYLQIIDLIGVPKSFIEENDLEINKVMVKSKKKWKNG